MSVSTITTERQTAKWDAQNILKNYFVVAGTQVGSALFSFATVWLATKLYSTDGYGNIVAVIAGSQVIQLFTNWTNVALARYGVQEFVESGKISRAFWGRSVIFLPNVLFVIASAPLWIYWLNDMLKLSASTTVFIVIHFFFSVLWLHFQQALQAVKMPRMQGILILSERVVIFLLVLLFGYVLKLNWVYVLYTYSASAFLMSVISYWQIRQFVSFKIVIDREWIKKLLSFSIPLIPYSVTSFFCTNYLDAFFITKYLTKSELGIYSVGYQINSLVLQFLVLVGTLLMPMFVTLRTKGHDKFIKQYLDVILPFFVLIWGVVIAFAAIFFGLLIPIVFGEEFHSLSPVIWIFMVGTTFTVPLLIGYSPFATAASAVYISFPLALTTAIANVLGNFILIPKWGLIGSAWATTISSVVSIITIVWMIKRRFRFEGFLLFQSMLPVTVGLIFFLILQDKWYASIIVFVLAVSFLVKNRDKFRESVNFARNVLIKKEFR